MAIATHNSLRGSLVHIHIVVVAVANLIGNQVDISAVIHFSKPLLNKLLDYPLSLAKLLALALFLLKLFL